MDQELRRAVGGGGNSAKSSVVRVLRVLDFELFRKLIKTSCPPLAGGPKSLISRWGKTSNHAERSEFENECSSKSSTQRGEFTPSLIREGRDGYYSPNPLAQHLSLLPIGGKRFQSARKKTEQLAPTSVLPQKGGCGINSHSEGNIHLTPKNLIKNNQIDLSLTAQDDINKSSELFNNFNTPISEKDFSRFTSHFSLKSMNRKAAFTLAEVLITLGIIGVVAAITMPVLMSNVQEKVKEKRMENIHQKLSKVTDKMAVQSGLTGYGDTMSFVQEMSKHMKLAKICDNNHISDCWPTQEVILNNDGKTWEISKTKNAKNLKINEEVADNWSDTVGIVTADGTAMILSYDKTCSFNVDDTGLTYSNDTGKSNSLVCLSGVYDWNGGKNPNKLGDDVITLGVAQGLGNSCALEVGNLCFSAAFTPTPLTYAECEEQKKDLGINACCSVGDCGNKDYWAGAVKQCGGVKNMPTMADLAKLATELYKDPTVGANQQVSNITLDTSKVSSLGFTGSSFYVWSGEEYDSGNAYYRGFFSSRTYWHNFYRNYSNFQAVCVGN